VAVRTAYAPVAATVLTAANLAKLPGGWIGYVETSTPQSSITANVDLTSLTLTVTVGTSRRIRITGYVPVSQSSATGLGEVDIYESGTLLARDYTRLDSTASLQFAVLKPVIVLTPSSGSHTYKLTASVSAGTMSTNPAATNPCHFTVEDIGPSS
jgi:hypothetical protein